MKRLSLTIAAALLLSHASVAHARERHRLTLPGGTLGDAVVALGRQAGISIGIADPLLALQRVQPVNGTFTADQALQRLLRGTGARSIAIDRSTFRIVRNPPPRPILARRQAPRPQPVPLPPEEPQPDIIITGTKRPVLLAAYPGAASLVDGGELGSEAGLRGSEALTARLPFVTSTHLGAGRNKLFLRGIADSSFNGPTQATVGQYFGETRLNYNAPDPDLRLYDIERVEILAGPQGTLYGAGSLGGIIRVIPNAPRLDLFEAGTSIGGALTRSGGPSFDGAAMLNLPMVEDRLGLRVVGYGASEGGYIDDVVRGRDDVNRTDIVGGRATIRADVPGGWTVDLGGAVQYIDGEAQYADRDLPPLTRDSPVDEDFSNLYALGELVVARQWGNFNFVSATGIVRQVLRERYDSTRNGSPPRVFDQENRITLLSAESRLSRQADDGSGWLVGISFLRNESEQSRAFGAPEAPVPITGVRNAVSETTLYGEATIPLTDWLSATAGARLTHSRLSGTALDPPVAFVALLAALRAQANRSETAVLPSLAFAAQPARGLLLFARYQEGFRPGGLAVSGNFVQRFRSDRVATVEAGARFGQQRTGLFDAAISFAYTRWRNVQADIVTMDGFPTTANIGDGRIYSIDLRVGWRPLAGLHFEASGTFNDSLVTNPAPSIVLDPASPLPNVARYNGRIGADYALGLRDGVDLRLLAAARYVGRSRLGIGAVFGEPQGDWLDLTAGARLELDRHAITLGVTNLLDANGNRFALGSPFTLVEDPQVTPLRPRTVRLGWEVRF